MSFLVVRSNKDWVVYHLTPTLSFFSHTTLCENTALPILDMVVVAEKEEGISRRRCHHFLVSLFTIVLTRK